MPKLIQALPAHKPIPLPLVAAQHAAVHVLFREQLAQVRGNRAHVQRQRDKAKLLCQQAQELREQLRSEMARPWRCS
jgi:hypothetical protein